MKKSIAFLSLLMLTLIWAPRASAQYEPGQMDFNLGIGLVPTFGAGNGGLPISISGDYGIKENIGIGGYLGYARSSETLPFFGKTTYSYFILGLRGTYHYPILDGLDTYGGALLGYNVASVSIENTFPGWPEPKAASGLSYSFFLGARYHFNDQFGAFGELGYGISILNLGLTLKL
ncbi:MAG: hypothetical protein EP332_13950 [Bacteroidetes bacterium]|nr:MAG: hypothetical protein EP332_13950 [Bacteroidota bacterium]